MQAEMNFNTIGHIENNKESQTYYDGNLDKFTNQCKKLMNYMMTGKKVNGDIAYTFLNIRHLPRRIKDLKDLHGVKIESSFNSSGMKDYWLAKQTVE